MPYDLFISYSRRDNAQGRITELVERIKQDLASWEGMPGRKPRVFFDKDEILGMSDWRQRILQGLRESRVLLACLSPAYFDSKYCEWEFVEYLKHEIGHLHGFNGVAPIYLVEVPGWENKNFEQKHAEWIPELRKRQHFDLRRWHDHGAATLGEPATREHLSELNCQIANIITRAERAEKSLGNVDAHNPHFKGRTAILRGLRENFIKPGHIGVVTAVNGVGGLGKTALAIEYAHAFAHEYGGGRWQVRCAGQDDLRKALAELATPIGFEFTDDEKSSPDLQFERTRRELKKLADARAPHRCLLFLDNVDRPGLLDPAQVARLNGGDWLHVLATTRLGENELHGTHRDRSFLAIDELPSEDALALIESYQPGRRFRSETERDAGHEIVRLLGSFTLAVETAAVYLGQFASDVTCAAFLSRLQIEGLDGLDTAATQSREGVLHGEKCLSATLQPTLTRLSPAETLTLEFAALLPPDQVPLSWLRALVAESFPEMERDAEPGYPNPWRNVLRSLFSLRLFRATGAMDEDGEPRVIRIHRLIQQSALRHRPAEERNTRQKSLNNFVLQRVTAKRIFWVESWEQSAILAVAELWDETKQPNASSLRSFYSRASLGRLGWGSKGEVNERAERAVELFNKAVTLQDWNQLHQARETFLQSIKYFSEAKNDYAAAIARIYFVVLLLESGETEAGDEALRKPEEFPDSLDLNRLLSRMSDRANVTTENLAWKATVRIQQAIEEISCKFSDQEHWLRNSLERQGEIYADNLKEFPKALQKFKAQEDLLLTLIPRIETCNRAATVFHTGVSLFEQRQLDRSCEAFRESLMLFTGAGSREVIKLAQVCFGAVLAEMEKDAQGRNTIEKIKHELSGQDYYENRLIYRGIVPLEKLREIFQQWSTANAWASLARCLGNQGVVLQNMNEEERALAAHGKAERICRQHDLKEALVFPLARQGRILSDCKGDHHAALLLVEEAADLTNQNASVELRQEVLGILETVRARICGLA